MICSRCNLQINEDDDICPYCGEPNKTHKKDSEHLAEYTEIRKKVVPEQKYFFRALFEMYKNYFNFNGTAGRGEYWSVNLIITLLLIPFMSIYSVVEPESVILTTSQVWIVNLTALFLFASVIPLFAMAVRRLHDANITGFAVLLNFIPGFGSLFLMILLLFPHKDNNY